MAMLRKDWPEAPATTLQRLRHTLDVYDFEDPPDGDKLAILATGGIYRQGQDFKTTGLTWDDLRAIRDFLV